MAIDYLYEAAVDLLEYLPPFGKFISLILSAGARVLLSQYLCNIPDPYFVLPEGDRLYPYNEGVNVYLVRIRDSLEDVEEYMQKARDVCTVVTMEDGKKVVKNASKVVSYIQKAVRSAKYALSLTDDAIDAMDIEIYTVFRELNSGEVKYPEYYSVLSLYAGVVSDIERGTSNTKYGGMRRGLLDVLGERVTPFSVLIGDGVERIEGVAHILLNPRGSMYTELLKLRKEYERFREFLEEETERRYKEGKKLCKELEEAAHLITRLEGTEVDILPLDVEGRIVEKELERLCTSLYTAMVRFSNGYNYLSSAEEVREIHENLKNLEHVIGGVERVYERYIDMCKGYLKGYRFYDSSLEERAKKLLFMLESSDVPVPLICEEIKQVLSLDKEARKRGEALDTCMDAYRRDWLKEPPLCETVECCMDAYRREYVTFLSSEEYSLYQELYTKLFEAYSETGGQPYSLILSIPRYPENLRELREYMEELYSLMKRFPVPGEHRWGGYLSLHSSGRVTLTISSPLLSKGRVGLFFDYITYEEEGNLFVYVGKTYVRYEGSGVSVITFVTEPYDTYEVLSTENGKRVITVENSTPVELRVETGRLLYASPGVREENGVVVIPPGGVVTLEITIVEIDISYEDNTAIVTLSNRGKDIYKGDIVLPFEYEKGYSFCRSLSGQSVCRVTLQPGETRRLAFHGVKVFRDEEPRYTTTFSPKEIEDMEPRDYNLYLSRLESYLERARELNAEYVLPYSGETLENMRRDPERYYYLAKYLDGYVRSSAEAEVELLKDLAKKAGDEETARMAEIAEASLKSGDFVLPLVLASKREKREDDSWVLNALAFVILGALLALVILNKGGKKKRRLPEW